MNRDQADRYNRRAAKHLDTHHLTELTAIAQEKLGGLTVDGMVGPKTRKALREHRKREERKASEGSSEDEEGVGNGRPLPSDLEDLEINDDGWLSGEGVRILAADPSWFYQSLETGTPIGIVWHYTATDPGSGEAMARRRMSEREEGDRAASWHVSIETDGTIIQMVPFTAGAWHCRATPEAERTIGREPNRSTVGLELVSHGEEFPEAQVAAAARVARALVRAYGIDHPDLEHRQLDPERRVDPGDVWAGNHADRVLEYAIR